MGGGCAARAISSACATLANAKLAGGVGHFARLRTRRAAVVPAIALLNLSRPPRTAVGPASQVPAASTDLPRRAPARSCSKVAAAAVLQPTIFVLSPCAGGNTSRWHKALQLGAWLCQQWLGRLCQPVLSPRHWRRVARAHGSLSMGWLNHLHARAVLSTRLYPSLISRAQSYHPNPSVSCGASSMSDS